MSTELKPNAHHPFSLTSYSGRDGASVQVTGPNCDNDTGYIGMNRVQAMGLAADLLQFALRLEVDNE